MHDDLKAMGGPQEADLEPHLQASDATPLDLTLIPAEEREAPDAPGPSWQNLNPLVNAIADAQGVEVGSRLWREGGLKPRSGDTGDHPAYGWRFTHRLTDNYRRAVLANYGHRRCYYLNAPFRQFGYDQAGRPHEWRPESPGDHPKGPVIYDTSGGEVRVSGPDAEHFWLTPLFALVDDPNPIDVPFPGAAGDVMPSNMVARWMATLLVSSAVGTVRNRQGDGTEPYPWTYGDRATGRLLHTMTEGLRRGLLLPQDLPTAASYVMNVVLPYYEKAPGIHAFGLARPGRYPIGLVNGFFWSVPVFWDAYVALSEIPGGGPLAERFKAVLLRWAQWAVDMDDELPGHWFGAAKLHVNGKFAEGADGMPARSLAPYFDQTDFEFWDSDYRPWAFRCVDICAKLSGDGGLQKARHEIAAAYADNEGQRRWMVDADGNYVTD